MEMSGYGYKASAGENVYGIARDVYGHEKYAADLLCANPELCLKIRMEGGEMWRLPTVDIPNDDQQELPDKAPWKE